MGFMDPGRTEVAVMVPLDESQEPSGEEKYADGEGGVLEDEQAEAKVAAWRKEHPWAVAQCGVNVRIAIRKPIVLPLDEQEPGLEIAEMCQPAKATVVPMGTSDVKEGGSKEASEKLGESLQDGHRPSSAAAAALAS